MKKHLLLSMLALTLLTSTTPSFAQTPTVSPSDSVIEQPQAQPQVQPQAQPQVQPKGEVLEDYAYQVRLSLPNDRWQFLDQKKSKQISSLGIIGATQPQTQMLGMILVEKVGNMPLEEYAQAIFDVSPLKDIQIEEVTEIDFQKNKAIQMIFTAENQQKRFKYINIITIRQGFAYQCVVAGPSAWTKMDDLISFINAIQLLDGKIEEPVFQRLLADQKTQTWQISNQTFESIFGFSVKAPPQWRLLVGKELAQINGEAEVGLMFQDPQIHVLISKNPCPVQNDVLCGEYFQKEIQKNLSLGAQKESFELQIQKEKMKISRFEHTHYQYYYGNQVIKGMATQFLAWGILGQTEIVTEYLKLLPDFVQPLTTVELSALKAKLVDQKRQYDFIDSEASLIEGEYRHYQHQLKFQVPIGIWQSEKLQGEQAKGWEVGKNQSSIFHLKAVEFDFDAYLISEQIHCVSQDAYHQKAWAQLSMRLGLSIQKQGTGQLIENQSIWTQGSKKDGELSLTYRLHTVCENGIGIQLLTTAPTVLFTLPLIMQVESGLSIDAKQAYISIENQKYIDQRFLFEINGIDFNQEKLDLKHLDFKIAALSTSLSLSTENEIMHVMAMSNLMNQEAQNDFSALENIIIDQVSQKHGTPPQSIETIFHQGLPAKKVVWHLDQIEQHLIVVVKAPILYAILTQSSTTAQNTESSFHRDALKRISFKGTP
jgi:hypothetical protein